MIIKKIVTGFCSIRTKRFKKLVALLLLFFSTFLHANTSSIKNAVEQLNYLLDYNQKNVANGESSKNWYVYVLGGNLDNLKYIIDETQNSSITDSFLLNLNKELIELNNGENAVYVALTEYMNPLITPVFDPDIIGEITSLDKMEEYIKGLIDSNDLNLSRADLTKSLSSFSVYKEDFLMKKEALIQTIYQEANLSNQSNGYKNVIMPFSDLSIRQIIQPNGTPPLKKKYYVYSLYIAKAENKWNKDEFKRLYTQSKNEIKGYGRNGIENKLERMVHTLAHYPFNEEVVSAARNCQELLHDDFYKKDLRPKLLQSGDKVWLDLIENNPCLLNDMYTYQDGLYAEGAEEYEKMLAKFVCYPLYGALAIPAISILGPTAVMEETAKSLIKRYGYKKIQDAGNAIAIDFTMQFTLSYYFDPEVNQLSGTERYTEAFAKTQLDDIASAVLSSMNNFDIPTELVINCLAGGIDADMEVLKNPETFMSNFDFSGCNNNMLGYLFLEVVLGKVSNHAATLTRLKNMVVQNPLSVQRGLKEIIDDASMGELPSKINNQWDDIADNLGVSKESDLYKVFDEVAIGNILDDDVLTLTSGWGDDNLDLLFRDLQNAEYGGNLIKAFNKKPELVKAWSILKNTGLNTKIKWLEKVSDFQKAGLELIEDGAEVKIFRQGDEIAKISEETLQIKIPYGEGWAKQSTSDLALKTLDDIGKSKRAYRLGSLNKSQAGEAQFWSPENPYDYDDILRYADKYGIPEENLLGDNVFYEVGIIKDGVPIITREAPDFGDNLGGAIEVVVPSNGMKLESFNMVRFKK